MKKFCNVSFVTCTILNELKLILKLYLSLNFVPWKSSMLAANLRPNFARISLILVQSENSSQFDFDGKKILFRKRKIIFDIDLRPPNPTEMTIKVNLTEKRF